MSGTWKRLFNLIAYVALVLVGIALLLAFIFKGNTISGAFTIIANVLAYIVVMFYAFIYAWSRGSSRDGKHTRRQMIYLAIWAVAAVLVIVFMILNI